MRSEWCKVVRIIASTTIITSINTNTNTNTNNNNNNGNGNNNECGSLIGWQVIIEGDSW